MPQATMQARPATLDDIATVVAIEAAFRPDEPLDPVVQRYEWETPEPGVTIERWIAELAGSPAGYGILFHTDWTLMTEKSTFAWLGWRPESVAILPELLEFVERRARDMGTARLEVYCREDEEPLVAVLHAAGYRLDTLARVWELDLVGQRDRLLELTAASRAATATQGIDLRTLSQHQVEDPYRELYDAWMLARRDMPRSHEMTQIPYELFRTWHHAPDIRADRTWVALDGHRIVGLSYLRYPPAGGRVWTGFTGTVGSHRGRGIARAVKMETLAQAIELGVESVRTDNDQRNAAMLHINEELGYTSRPAFADYEKEL
jgi:RimJ/RimL family protein N-acetyltransferase